ncbi:MAG: VWA domain-containing protein [Deltaproteobacteria bacterium]|nr:VWA domain-containing protein [Deltaproteobacteria bacterium]
MSFARDNAFWMLLFQTKLHSTLRLMLAYGVAALVFSCTDSSLELLPPPPPPIPDNKLLLSGTICTQNPEELIFPARVVFLVDCSESMDVTDPPDPVTGETGRERAVREAAVELLGSGGDVKVSVVRFSSESQPLTAQLDPLPGSYFTNNLETVLANLPRLSQTDRTTNYIQALAEVYSEIRHELINAEQESLALSSYQVVLVSDGIPDVDSGDAAISSTDNVLESVEAIMELGRLFHINRIGVNTALLSSGNVLVDEVAEDLLSAMAERGAGTFRSFASGGELNFLGLELTSMKRMFTLKTLVAQNINSVSRRADMLPDSDGDGVDDMTEILSASNPFMADSDGDGCRDGVEYRFRLSGMDPLDPNDCDCFVPDYCFDEDQNGICDNSCTDSDGNGQCDCADANADAFCDDNPTVACVDAEHDGICECVDENLDHICDLVCLDANLDGFCDCIDVDKNGRCDDINYNDFDGDGLFNCEEIYAGTNRRGPDSDGDGLVDFLEFRFGTKPDEADDEEDMDWDVVTNGEEVRTATDPLNKITTGRGKQAYRYNVKEIDGTQTQTCYSFEVSNITLTEVIKAPAERLSSGPAGQGYSSYNRILLFAGEVPFDDPQSYARFRVACVEARFTAKGNFKEPPSGRVVGLAPRHFHLLTEFNPDEHCIGPGDQL